MYGTNDVNEVGILLESNQALRAQVVENGRFMNDEVKEILSHPTADVPTVGKVFYGLERHASYRAAKRGDIACVRVGGRVRAITQPLRKLVEPGGIGE